MRKQERPRRRASADGPNGFVTVTQPTRKASVGGSTSKLLEHGRSRLSRCLRGISRKTGAFPGQTPASCTEFY